jgi:hypothetical protein
MAEEIRPLQDRLQDLLFKVAPPHTTVYSGRGGLFIPVVSERVWITVEQDGANSWTITRFRAGCTPEVEIAICEWDILSWVQTYFMEKRK